MKIQSAPCLLSIFVSLMICSSGCTTNKTVTSNADGNPATTKGTTLDPERTAEVIRAIIPAAVRLAIAREPDSRVWIHDAQLAVCAISDSKKVSPKDLKRAVKQSGVQQLQTPEAQAAIEAVYGIYTAYYGDVINQNLSARAQTAALVPVLKAICESLSEGLAGL